MLLISYHRSWIKRCLGALALAALCSGAGLAAGEITEYTVKSAYVYNFIQLVDWPARETGAAAGPIKICVIDSGPLGEALSGLNNRQVSGRSIHVSSSTSADAGLAYCHIVVIGRPAQDQLPGILKKLEGAHILTVGDIPQFARKGGIIGFVNEEGRVRIELNIRAARQGGLKVSAKLMEVARIIK
jgi:hypothetical protein